MSAIDDHLKLAGLSPQWRQGFYVATSHGLLNPLADTDTTLGYLAGKKLAGKTPAVILATVREQYAADPLNTRALALIAARAQRGRETYGTTLYDAKLDRVALLRHQIDELADALMYSLAELATYEEAE
jgi:hypothetical protein